MKVRIGIGTGQGAPGPEGMAALAGALVEHRFDSLWMPEILTVPGHDPLVALAWVAGRCPGLKVGTTMLAPGRNLVRLAKQVASLDTLSGGRFLVTLVPGIARGAERDAVGLEPRARGAAMDDALPVLRRLWAGEEVTHDGPAGTLRAVTVEPRPVQDPFEVWLGGLVPSSLERCGRLGDGWLPALCTPAEAAAGRRVIEEVAGRHRRAISPEHFGVSLAYAAGELPAAALAQLAARAPGKDPADLIPQGLPALRSLLERFLEVGFSKFVVRPVVPPADWGEELATLAAAVGDLQT